MPVANYETYCKMLDRAREGHFAYPAINVTSLTTANAVLKGLAETKSDGIIQVSTGGGAFASGVAVKDMALGAISIAEHVHRVAKRYPIYVALHTDHCQADKLDKLVIPLVEETEKRRSAGKPNLFNSHMFDGSALPLKDNLDIAVKLLERFQKNDLILESEASVVVARRTALSARHLTALYHSEDTLEVASRLNTIKVHDCLLLHSVMSTGLQARTCEAEAKGTQGMSGGGCERIRGSSPLLPRLSRGFRLKRPGDP
jgi:fructose-bisphosphate aldolase class II